MTKLFDLYQNKEVEITVKEEEKEVKKSQKPLDVVAADAVLEHDGKKYTITDLAKFKEALGKIEPGKDEAAFKAAFKAEDLSLAEKAKEKGKGDEKPKYSLSGLYSSFKSGCGYVYNQATETRTRQVLTCCAVALVVAAVACRLNGQSLSALASKAFESAKGMAR